ncbi:TIGR03885 family FMN-dependent LLM class oxidoreductase [Dyadobacter sp. CY326]|uniref:TIGR03885 family FMN-dependent LLM class oxidoreductase n=1 Tax=Dyadobacter sp. CY326 TaxID=2907300 RepID=UPI001F2783BB|nr:TIGR03885 family FMN-dependent LLM class oxidoreductase [Dyadobacter sp. CY326]MCE7063778.1 TIGR03885 family FMN-dependent LLM class oxidoreductase [Dyadobacter sp. CY326]
MTSPNLTAGFHASHEQFKPSELLAWVQMAEAAGFTHSLCSDHYYPWSESQGESGFAWSWLGAAMHATSMNFGIVNAPVQRYSPAIIAQAVATLCEMFPGKFWIATGSGQFLNEHINGEKWPSKEIRNERLKECVDIMRALWRGEMVSHKGHVVVEEAKLYTRPDYIPTVIGAAITPKTARWIGGWADGMITISKPYDELKATIDAFREGGGEGKPVYVKVQLSYDTTYEKALQGAHEQWRNNVFASALLSDVKLPEAFDAAGAMIQPNEILPFVRVSDSTDRHIEWLSRDFDAGATHVYLHNVNREQEQFINVFGEKVLPALSRL